MWYLPCVQYCQYYYVICIVLVQVHNHTTTIKIVIQTQTYITHRMTMVYILMKTDNYMFLRRLFQIVGSDIGFLKTLIFRIMYNNQIICKYYIVNSLNYVATRVSFEFIEFLLIVDKVNFSFFKLFESFSS